MIPLPKFEPRSAWVPPKLSELPSWRFAKRVAVDLETHDPELTELGPGVRRGARIVGIGFAIEDGPSAYLPIGHRGEGNLDPVGVLAYMREQAAVFRGDLVGAHLPYDLDFLAEADVTFTPHRFRDVLIAEPLLDENQFSYSLGNVAHRRGLPGKDETQLRAAAAAFGIDPKRDLHLLHPRHVGAYGEQDCRLPLTLLRRQERVIDEEEIGGIWDLECRVLPVLLAMRRRGVRVSLERLQAVEDWCLGEETRACSEIARLTGVRLALTDLTKSEAQAPVLRAIGLEVPLTPTTRKPSIDKAFLAAHPHEVTTLLARARRINKVRLTFVGSIRRHIVKGRIHTTFNQLKRSDDGDDETEGTIARLSSVDPNLQQQPARDPELGPLWRSIYMPDAELWGCLDFSQQEPRWLVHFASASATHAAKGKHPWPRIAAESAQAAVARYVSDPSTDSHTMTAEITGLKRKDAKEVFLGRCYGMGSGKMALKIGKPTVEIYSKRQGRNILVAGPEAQAIIDQFDARVPYVKELAARAEAVAKRQGYIRTVLGRRSRFPLRPDGKYDWVHKALNRLIQNSSADQTKKAMVDAAAAGIEIQLQVHDELDGSFRNRQEAEALADIMRTCVPCLVPHKVDVETGPSWGELTG